jgi:hypothetical protein
VGNRSRTSSIFSQGSNSGGGGGAAYEWVNAQDPSVVDMRRTQSGSLLPTPDGVDDCLGLGCGDDDDDGWLQMEDEAPLGGGW